MRINMHMWLSEWIPYVGSHIPPCMASIVHMRAGITTDGMSSSVAQPVSFGVSASTSLALKKEFRTGFFDSMANV